LATEILILEADADSELKTTTLNSDQGRLWH